jgi:hypothetical protein
MEGIGSAIFGGFITLAIITFVVGGIIVGGIWHFADKDYIESKTIITPEIKLTTDGKKIDTLYIYKPQH